MYGMAENVNAEIGEPIEDFVVDKYQDGKIDKVFLSDYAGKWVVLFFYPADFTFVCPTELEDIANIYEKFTSINTEILSVSTDTAFSHKAWAECSPAIKKVDFPMLADPSHELSEYFNVLIRDEGIARRGTFILNPEGVLVAMEVSDNSIGRNAKELLRKVQAAQFVYENGDQVCPAGWEPGDDTITPSADLVGKI
jgi:peroxiredoxin (alkyl hydroperoxide reductase subunit C)